MILDRICHLWDPIFLDEISWYWSKFFPSLAVCDWLIFPYANACLFSKFSMHSTKGSHWWCSFPQQGFQWAQWSITVIINLELSTLPEFTRWFSISRLRLTEEHKELYNRKLLFLPSSGVSQRNTTLRGRIYGEVFTLREECRLYGCAATLNKY